MKEETRIMIAFGLALAVIILFSILPSGKKPDTKTAPHSEKTIAPEVEICSEFEISDRIMTFENELYDASVDLLGGKIVKFALKNYTRPGEERFLFFQNGNTLADIVEGETEQVNYAVCSDSTLDVLVLKGRYNGIEILKQLKKYPSRYSMDVSIVRTNIQDKSIIAPSLNVSLGSVKLDKSRPEESSIEFLVLNSGKPYKFNVARQMKERISGNACVFKTRYHLYYFKSTQPVEFYVESKASEVRWGIILSKVELDPESSSEFPFLLYIGPSDYFIAKSEIDDMRVFGTGFFVSMGRLIFYVLNSIHKVIPNWGFAIVVLTILIKVIFFPLTRTSLRSMKQIQKLRPYLQDLQKKYKDNPQLMQKEMMNLYKAYKINPLSGCLPMLIQIPIFVGFFLALRSSIYLRGSGFIFWIKDLSLPDTIAKIAGFPINILPFIMLVSSFLQMRITPAVEQSQKMMNIIFPFMLFFLFYNFSSGLLLYWVTMNVLSLLENYYIYKLSK